MSSQGSLLDFLRQPPDLGYNATESDWSQAVCDLLIGAATVSGLRLRALPLVPRSSSVFDCLFRQSIDGVTSELFRNLNMQASANAKYFLVVDQHVVPFYGLVFARIDRLIYLGTTMKMQEFFQWLKLCRQGLLDHAARSTLAQQGMDVIEKFDPKCAAMLRSTNFWLSLSQDTSTSTSSAALEASENLSSLEAQIDHVAAMSSETSIDRRPYMLTTPAFPQAESSAGPPGSAHPGYDSCGSDSFESSSSSSSSPNTQDVALEPIAYVCQTLS